MDARGKQVKECIRMTDGRLTNGDPHPLYFPEGHEEAGWFKGMAQLLVERGYVDASQLKAECKHFKCPGDGPACCCRQLMYSQPDFTSVESRLESSCRVRGFHVIFVPKYYCELNFTEQCWGFC